MKKRLASLLLTATAYGLTSCGTAEKKETAQNPVQTEQTPEKPRLPNFQVTDLEGKLISTAALPANRPTVVLFFHPDCEHCQAEARELQKHNDDFADVNFLMITWDEMPKIKEFMTTYGLRPPIAAYQINPNTLAQTYGQFKLPAVYIYNANRELVQQLSGEAKAEAIKAYLTQ